MDQFSKASVIGPSSNGLQAIALRQNMKRCWSIPTMVSKQKCILGYHCCIGLLVGWLLEGTFKYA